MKDAVQVLITGVKCDAPGCAWNDPSADNPEAYLNMACPSCGANLLTQEDYDMIRIAKATAAMFSAHLPQSPDDSEKVIYAHGSMDGTGSINWDVKK